MCNFNTFLKNLQEYILKQIAISKMVLIFNNIINDHVESLYLIKLESNVDGGDQFYLAI